MKSRYICCIKFSNENAFELLNLNLSISCANGFMSEDLDDMC